jgi:hypothetical protein
MNEGKYAGPGMILAFVLFFLWMTLTENPYVHADAPPLLIGALKPCDSLEGVTAGRWSDMGANARWQPYMCKLDYITDNPAYMSSCFQGKKVGFYGDSTLRQIAGVAMNLTNPHFADLGMRVFGGTSPVEGGGEIKMAWTPSAYYQTPVAVGNLGGEDITVISIGLWDMGTYYRGVSPWYDAMEALLHAAAKAREGKPLYVIHIHRVYNSKCVLKEDEKEYHICKACNSLDANLQFREALANVVTCLQELYDIRLIDTWALTNTSYGEAWSNGVHVKGASPQMELEVLLQSACGGLPTVPPGGRCSRPTTPLNEKCKN